MNLVARAKEMITNPASAWTRIDAENPPAATVATTWLLPFALLGALAAFLGFWWFGAGGFGVSIHYGFFGSLKLAIMGLVAMLVTVTAVSALVSALAPRFGGQSSFDRAFALMSYGAAGALIGNLAAVVPLLSILALVGALYSLYLIYKGLPVMMKSPPQRSALYLILIIIGAFLISLVFAWLSGGFGGSMGGGDARITIGTPMGEIRTSQSGIDEASRKIEAAARKLEDATRAPSISDRTPIAAQTLKAWLPSRIAGLERKTFEVNDGNVAGLGGSTAKASYGEGARRIEIEVLDAGGAAGLLNAFAGLHAGEKETESMIERSYQVDKRKVIEKRFKKQPRAELTTILANGVMVKAESRGIDFEALDAAVKALDLGKLEGR